MNAAGLPDMPDQIEIWNAFKTRATSLLLTSTSGLLLALTGDDLAQHHHTVSVHECHTRQTLAVLECVAHQGLLWCKAALGHFVRFQRVRVVHLFTSSLLAHLPLELRDAAS